jgi:hypothetical protein
MTKPDPTRMALLEAVLTRAAEDVGDLTRPAMALFYERYPEAKAAFERHAFGNRERLEAEMVDTALYCLMTWLEREIEVSILLHGSVPHHNETLHVRPEWYSGLLSSVIDVIASTIPADAADEVALMQDIRRDLLDAIEQALAS